jgi:chemotaxis protein methyltransferase CheR
MEKRDIRENAGLSDEELRSLTDAIQKRHGIDFGCYEPLSLKRRLARSLHVFQMQSVHELWIRILREHAFIYTLMDEISVGLTAMFRDPILWKTIKGLLIDDFARRGDLSIWHAGCSTGEEVFTMGIVLKESKFPSRYSALATDISNNAMDTATRGAYGVEKMQDYENNYLEYNALSTMRRYYEEKGKTIFMDLALTRHVHYAYHNLISGEFTRKFDIIFCRNVMIYFDNNAKRRLFEKFYESLNAGGILVIGFYDAVLPMVDPSRFRVLDMDARIFQKL